jgi:uncharacterized protein YndB with AHSA1/START domain
MNSQTATKTDDDRQLFTITHTVKAPRELAFAVFTGTHHLRHWWGPKGFTVDHCSTDLRAGGIFHYSLKAPDGSEMWGRFAFTRIEAPGALAFVNSFSDANGGLTRHPLAPNWPQQTDTLITFDATGDEKTEITVDWTPHKSSTAIERETFAAGHDSMKQGWGGTFAKLDDYLESIRAI